jgi:predicted DNA-binding protein
MKMVRLLIQVPEPIKARLDALRQEGTTASGFIRHLLEQHFSQGVETSKKGR